MLEWRTGSLQRSVEVFPRALWLPLVMALGAGLRLYRLHEVPVWFDDFAAIQFMRAPDAGVYLSLVRLLSPDHMPLFFLLQYAWGCIVGVSPVRIRLLCVLLSVAAIALAYCLGKRVYGRNAGLIAALLAALSPLHIWYAQTMRYNPLVEVLALASLYALLRAVEDRRCFWWALHVAANGLLVWTHVLTVALLLAEGCFLLVAWPGPLRARLAAAVRWGLAQLPVLALAPVWLRASAANVSSGAEDYYGVSGWNVLVDLFADDAATLVQPWMFFSSPRAWIPRNPYADFIAGASFDGWMNRALAGLFAGVFLWTALRVFVAGLRRRPEQASAEPGPAPRSEALLLLAAVLPVAALAALTFTVRPCLQPQYTIYSSFALYAMLGHALCRLPACAMRRGAMAAVAVLYAYQLFVLLPESTRTDWRSAAQWVKSQAEHNDLILVRGKMVPADTFRFAMGETQLPVLNAYTLEAVSTKSVRYLEQAPDARVWAVIEVAFDYEPLPVDALERALAARGLNCARTFFPGMGGIAVLRIARDTSGRPAADAAPEIPVQVDYAPILRDLGLLPAGMNPAESQHLPALRRTVEALAPSGVWSYAMLAISLCDEGCLGEAEHAARRAIASSPESGLGYFALAIAHGEQGRAEAAMAAFRDAIVHDRTGYFRLFEAAFTALYERSDLPAARDAIAALDRIGALVPQTLRARSGALPAAGLLRLCEE